MRTSIPRTELMRIMGEGQFNAEAGLSIHSCPYSPTLDEATRIRAAAWIHGYAKAKRAIADRLKTTR